jgi:ribosome biogenesis GTPase A
MKEQMGSMIKVPLTREEAIQILNVQTLLPVEEVKDPAEEAQKVMERFEIMFEKNLPEKGGSFYL